MTLPTEQYTNQDYYNTDDIIESLADLGGFHVVKLLDANGDTVGYTMELLEDY